MSRIVSLMVTALVLVATAAPAQDVKKADPVVVTATKTETPQGRLGAAVTVITEEDIRAHNHVDIEEVLRTVPGVEVQRSGTFGKETAISIRGAGPKQVQVLIDGMRVKQPTQGFVDLSDLSLDAVERIEVVRGPQSTLYGADAIGGVVNIITRKGTGPPTGTLSFEGGSHQTFREQATLSGAAGAFNYSFAASRFDSRGQERTFDNDDSDQTTFAGRLGFDLSPTASVTATGRYAKSSTDVPNQGFFPFDRDPDSQQQNELALFTLRYDQKLFEWWEIAGRMGQLWHDTGFQDVAHVPGDFGSVSQIDTRRREFEVLSTWHAGKVNSVTLGVEHRNERAYNRHTFRAETNTRSLFLQDELRLFDRLVLGGGVRFEDSDAFGGEWTPRLSLAVLLRETGTKLRGAWGKGFRAPTLNDLFFPDFTGGFCPPFGNPALEPERSTSWEAGVDQRLWEGRVRGGLTYFRNKFRNLITSDLIPATFCFQATNVGHARTEGVEYATEVEPLDWLLFSVNYTFTQTENELTGRELTRFARHRWNAGVTVTPVPRLSLFVQSHVASSTFEGDTLGRKAGYYRLDAGGTFAILQRPAGHLERLEFTVRVQNLTDTTYQETLGFRALGFTALAGLRGTFR
jgi:vitamin B12 transporter